MDARAKQHTVKSGETLYGISKKYNVPVDDIKRLNRLSSNSLKVGQVLTLEVESNEGGATYKVKSGDNLSSIAKKNNMTVQELKELNNLSSNSLKAGQVLTLKKAPVASSNYKTYTVKPGDNLYRIGLNNNTTEAQIIALNDLPS
ncbi:MAG TPA: LysM peptidoglycan-binding domain-containing protein, partial [Candidatus Cloacimonadota bacterium]|nr:LysM peptidoglycan-binding domain-containing protein [Candidatus Cloacimonadota bacterium]